MVKLYTVLALVFSLAGIVIWLAFVRPVEQQTGLGTIRSKAFRPAGTYVQQQPGITRGFRTPTDIPIAESDVLEIVLDGREAQAVPYALNTVASRSLSVGQRVRVTYIERSFGPFWRRIYVLDVVPDEAPSR